ncbi:MAG: hypothetical protein ABI197_06585 [Granulicella sp.]
MLLGEPGQRNLLQPSLTIEVYVGVALAMLAATFVARRFTAKKSLFPNFLSLEDMGRASLGCFLVGAASQLYNTFGTPGAGNGSLLSALNQLNNFLPLAMVLGVTYEIRKSGGRRAMNAVIFLSGALIFAGGILGYSKQGILEPFACWVFAAAAQRYKISVAQIAGLLMAAVFISYYLVPYAQFGRGARGDTVGFRDGLKISIILLSNLDLVRAAYKLDEQRYSQSDNIMLRYYDKSQGLADRLQMIAPDDVLIDATQNSGSFGLLPLIFAFENNIPHFLWPGKPVINFGNIYAREVGIITDQADVTTGVSFSAAGDMYHQAKWGGILALLPVLLFVLFVVTDSCCGDTRTSPFALLALILFLHSAPEGGGSGIIRDSTFGIVALFVVAFLSTKVMPVVANLFAGKLKTQPQSGSIFQPQPAAFAAVAVPGAPGPEVPPPAYRWSNPRSNE